MGFLLITNFLSSLVSPNTDLSLIAHFVRTQAACRIAYEEAYDQPTSAYAVGTRHVASECLHACDVVACIRMRVRVFSVVHYELSARGASHESSIVRPGMPDRRDHVRGRRVFRASLLHVVHQRAILALVRVEIRLLTACHTATVPGIHFLQVI